MKQSGFITILELMIVVGIAAIVVVFVVALACKEGQFGGSPTTPGDVVVVNPDGSTSTVPGSATTEGEPENEHQKQQIIMGILIAAVVVTLLIIVILISMGKSGHKEGN
jgi:ABC-type cobalt transport system substrate-binding protein